MKKRTLIEKIKIFLFWEDVRITEGEPYTQVREHDFSSYYPKDNYVKKVPKGGIAHKKRDVKMLQISDSVL